MAAWGYKPFENQLAQDYVTRIVVEHLHPILVEVVECSTSHKMHKWAYYYDRFRAAVELMILLETSGAYRFAAGFYALAIEKLVALREDDSWRAAWDDKSGTKSRNYVADVDRQLASLTTLYKVAEP